MKYKAETRSHPRKSFHVLFYFSCDWLSCDVEMDHY